MEDRRVTQRVLSVLAVIYALGACGEGEPQKAQETCTSGACTSQQMAKSASRSPVTSAPPPDASASAKDSSVPSVDANTPTDASSPPSAAKSSSSTTSKQPSAADKGANPPAMGTPLPCEVRKVVSEHCWSCHGATLRYTAPMHLLNVEDFQEPSPSDPARSVAESAHSRIRDAQRPMPPQPFARIEGTELMAVDAWLNGATLAPGSADEDCPLPPPIDVTPPAADGGTTSETADPNVVCKELRVHGDGPGTAFKFDNAVDLYQCFEFATPFGPDDVYGISFKPKIENSSVIHHILMYQHNDSAADGSFAPCAQLFPQSSLVAAWGPGVGDMIMPADVAMQLPASGYTLEVHYNGSGNDTSGIEVCYTREPRKNTAAMHWLGTTNILGTTAGNVCRPTNTEPIHTLKHWPHMHKGGLRLTTVITRASGEMEPWFDEPYDFQSQKLWDTDKIIMPGDTIETTCTFSRPSIGGEGTNQEMCYDVVLAYPAGALTQPGPGSGFGTHQCVN